MANGITRYYPHPEVVQLIFGQLLSLEQHALSKPELETLIESYGGHCLPSTDQTLLIFADYHWARRCHYLLGKRGVSSLSIGCHLHLQEPG